MKYISIFLIILSLTSCKKNFFKSCMTSAGDNSTRMLSLGDFNKLNIQDRFKIHFVQDSIQSIEIKGKENLIEKLSFTVKDGTLSLKDDNKCKIFKGYHTTELVLHFDTLEQIILDGNSELYSHDTLNFKRLFVESHADMSKWNLKINSENLIVKLHAVVGEMKVSGLSNSTYIYTSGSNHIFFKDLVSQYVNINHSGLGNIHVTAMQNISSSINKYGDIHCYGQPDNRTVKYGIEGTGSVFYHE